MRAVCLFLVCGVALTACGSTSHANHTGRLWAVLVTGSQEYRHAADVGRQYRILRRNGVPASRIVRLTPDRMLRNVDLARVRPRAGDRLYVFIAGHGTHAGISLGAQQLSPPGLGALLGTFARRARVLVAIEACNSGVFGSIASSRIAVLTASRPDEASVAAGRDPVTGIWRSDEFANALAAVARSSGSKTLPKALDEISTHVDESHPQLYGETRGLRLRDFFS